MKFYVGQIFEDAYPPEAVEWCEANDCLIYDIKSDGDTVRYQIQQIPDLTDQQQLQQAKQQREDAVSKITVTVDGMTFDGDETAQTRIGRTVAAAIALGVDLDTYTQTWVLADNSIANPTIKQLATVLKLAGEKQTELWIKPYQQ